MPRLNERVQGKLHAYIPEQLLVQGRFGSTFVARRAQDQERVILKMIVLEQAPGWEQLEAFERHGERLRQLDHPHIARYLDSVALAQDPDGPQVGLVQQLCQADSIQAHVERHGPMPIAQALRWWIPALDALRAMHELEPPILHGDLDPGNVLLSGPDAPTLVDLATVRQALLHGPRLASGLARGELDYAPVEQLLGKAFPASDLYALALTFIYAVTGLTPAQLPILDGIRIDVQGALGLGRGDALVTLLRQLTEPDPTLRLGQARLALERARALASDSAPRMDLGLASTAAAPTSSSHASAPRSAAPDEPPSGADWAGSLASALAALPDPALLASLWDELDPGHGWRSPELPELHRVHAFAANRDATSLILARGARAVVLSGDALQERASLSLPEGAQRVALSRDGRRAAVLVGFERLLCFDLSVSVWLRHELTVEGMWPGHSQLTFSPDGELLAISDDDQVNLYRWADGQLVARHDVDGQLGLEFDPTGRLLFACGQQAATILDGQSSQPLARDAIAFSPDGSMMAATSGHTLHYGTFRGLWPSLQWDHREVSLKEAMGQRLTLLRFSPDQRRLAVASPEGFVRVIDLATGQVLPCPDERAQARPQVKLFGLGFDPDARRLLIHATLHAAPLCPEPLGGVHAMELETGRFLGAMAWLDEKLGLLSAPGFFGPLEDAGFGGFSSRTWARADMARRAFLGEDISRVMSAQERALHREFALRRDALRALWAHEGRAWALGPVTDAMAGLMPLLPHVLERAAALDSQAQRVGSPTTSLTRQDALLRAAQACGELRPDELRALLKDSAWAPAPLRAQATTTDPATLGRLVYAAQTPYAERQDSYSAQTPYAPTTSYGAAPAYAARPASASAPAARRSALAAPLPQDEDDALPAPAGPGGAGRRSLLAGILSLCMALGVILLLLIALDYRAMTPSRFWLTWGLVLPCWAVLHMTLGRRWAAA